MLENITTGTKVLFTNGKKGTVTKASEGGVFIKPLGGSWIPRKFNLDGTAASGDTDLRVQSVILTYDFDDGNGEVEAVRFMNPEGDEGGIVALTATILGNTRISRGSRVFGNAYVQDSHLSNKMRVGGNTSIRNFS